MKLRSNYLSAMLIVTFIASRLPGADVAASQPDKAPNAPAVLPGGGLAEHDFFYAGESRQRRMFIVKRGQITWSYDNPAGKGEISDAVLLGNGNILIAHQFAVKLVTPEKKVAWEYEVPKGCEVHTAVPVGVNHILFIQNGPKPFLRVVEIASGKTDCEFPLPVKNPKSVHGQFRHARLTSAGTVMVAHMDLGKVCEYDFHGTELWSYAAPGVWGVTPLANGNILVVDHKGVHEVNRKRETVWEVLPSDIPEYKVQNLQLAWRLPNGNTLFNNWVNEWNGQIDHATAPAQAIELSPDKKVVWALRSWMPPAALGPATTIQLLDQQPTAESFSFGDIK